MRSGRERVRATRPAKTRCELRAIAMRPIIAVGTVLGVTGCVRAAAVLRPTGAEVNTIRLREESPRWRMHGEMHCTAEINRVL